MTSELKNFDKIRYCNCKISSNKNIFNPNVNHSFCEKCGCILIKTIDGGIYYTLHKHNRNQNELDPINIIRIMKKRAEEHYLSIYKLNNSNNIFEVNKNENPIKIYIKKRKMIISKLQELIKIFNNYDSIFFETLYYLDTYLSHDITKDMSLKTILYYLVGYFLCVIKLKDIDGYEPTFDTFIELEKGFDLSQEKIADYELICLKKINYNIFNYSSYDWIMALLSNGVIFNNEIENNNEIILIKGHRHSIINVIKKYALKLLFKITIKPIFFKYSPMYLALSLIQISREKYIENKLIKPQLFYQLINSYGIDYTRYQNCYEEIKTELYENNNINGNEEKIEVNQTDKESKTKEKPIKDIKRNFNYLSDKNINTLIFGKNISEIPQIRRSSHVIINSKKDIIKKSEKFKDNNNTDNNNKNNELNNNEFTEQNTKKLPMRKKHFSIDCSNNAFDKNTRNLIIIKDKKEELKITKDVTKQNIFLSSIQNEEKNDYLNKKDGFDITNITFGKKRHLTSKKLEKINFGEFDSDNNVYRIKSFKQNEIFLINNFMRNSKIKSNKNLITGISLQEKKL